MMSKSFHRVSITTLFVLMCLKRVVLYCKQYTRVKTVQVVEDLVMDI